jgi:hypothetical protein
MRYRFTEPVSRPALVESELERADSFDLETGEVTAFVRYLDEEGRPQKSVAVRAVLPAAQLTALKRALLEADDRPGQIVDAEPLEPNGR